VNGARVFGNPSPADYYYCDLKFLGEKVGPQADIQVVTLALGNDSNFFHEFALLPLFFTTRDETMFNLRVRKRGELLRNSLTEKN